MVTVWHRRPDIRIHSIGRTLRGRFHPGIGEGSIHVEVAELDISGQTRWGAADDLIVLQTGTGLLHGESSEFELCRQLLAHELQSGKISRQDYEQQTRRLLERGKIDLGR